MRRGYTLSELARRAGVGKATLSQLEAGTGNPSLETLWALAVALDVPIAQLIDPPAATTRVVRAGEGTAIAAEGADYVATLLAAGPPHVTRDVFRITAEPGTPRHSAPHQHGLVEHVYLATGRALVGPEEDPVDLGPGDFATYPGDVAHVFTALAPGTTAVLVSEQPWS